MLKKIVSVAAIAAATLTVPASAYALDFPAAPVNAGPPTVFPGEEIFPGMRESRTLVNGVTQPILQPILAPGGGAPVVEPAGPVRHHHHHHHKHTS